MDLAAMHDLGFHIKNMGPEKENISCVAPQWRNEITLGAASEDFYMMPSKETETANQDWNYKNIP